MAEIKGKKVLGFSGSPRRLGNTEVLVDEVLRGARDAGATTERLILADMDISPCDACGACKDTGECVIGDDMEQVLDKMAQSDVWVLGTPVYWWGPSAQFKLFLDRWYSRIHRAQDKAMFRGRRVILVAPMGDADPATPQHLVGMLRAGLDYVDAEFFATVLAYDVSEPGEVRSRSEVMKAAYEAGRRAVAEGGKYA
jgi:multimeric flavodoxin WrbA